MNLLSKLLLGILVMSAGILASPRDDGNDNYGNCQDGSRRSPAAAASLAGRMPDCAAYVSTSTITTTIKSTRVFSAVVTTTSSVNVSAKTTVMKTVTTTLNPTTVTSTVPFTITSVTTSVTTTSLPVVVVTSFVLFKRDGRPAPPPPPPPRPPPSPPPPPPKPKCSCIVVFATVTVTQFNDQTVYSTKTTTITSAVTDTQFTTTTTTITPVSSVTVSMTITTTTTLTSTQTVTQRSTTIRSIPSACAGDLTAPPVNLAANTITHPEDTYTSIYAGPGEQVLDILDCCATCYSRPGCYSFNFFNFDPFGIPQVHYSSNYCQVFIQINPTTGQGEPGICTHPERSNFITFGNPGNYGAGPGDFFYGGTGPCSTVIDVSVIS